MAAITELTAKVAYSASGVLAFEGATLIDGSGRPALANATVLVSNGKIVAAGPAGDVKVPADAKRIDVTWKFIIPGLWDMHPHYQQQERAPLYPASGVTPVRHV